MSYLFYIPLAILPSIIWLLFYLRKDSHPEPNRMVIRVFIWGILIAPLAALIQLSLKKLSMPGVSIEDILFNSEQAYHLILLNIMVFAPMSEEILKYLVVKFSVLKNINLDEPVDIMLYCIIAALGFAAVENILLVANAMAQFAPFQIIASHLIMRSLSAVFLHVLASGILGYFLALSIIETQKRGLLLSIGLSLAIFLHAVYNYLIWLASANNHTKLGFYAKLAILLLLTFSAVLVSWQLKQLRQKSSICKIN